LRWVSVSLGLVAVAIALYAVGLFFLVRTTGPEHMRARPLPLAILTVQMSAYVALATYAVLRRSDSIRAAILLGMTAAFFVEGAEFALGLDTTASGLFGAAIPLFLAFGFALIESSSWLRSFVLGLLAAVVAVLGVYATLFLQKGL
jgi:hypothetical protein